MGRSTIPALHDAGHTVVGLARSSKAAAVVAARGAEPVMADLFDADALAQAMQGCDAVVNLATQRADRLRHAGPRRLARQRPHPQPRHRHRRDRRPSRPGSAGSSSRASASSTPTTATTGSTSTAPSSSPARPSTSSSPRARSTTSPVLAAWASPCGSARSLGSGPQHGLAAPPGSGRSARPASASRDSWTHVVHADDVGTAVVRGPHGSRGCVQRRCRAGEAWRHGRHVRARNGARGGPILLAGDRFASVASASRWSRVRSASARSGSATARAGIPSTPS